MRSLRNVPILTIAFAAMIVSGIVQLVLHGSPDAPRWAPELAFRGVWYATIGGCTVGCVELADRLAGRARIGALVAATGFGLRLAIAVASLVGQAVHEFHGRGFFDAVQWCGVGATAIALAGLAVAACSRLVPALAAVAVAALADPSIGSYLINKLVAIDSLERFQAVDAVLLVVRGAALLYLVALAGAAAPLADDARAARGLRWCASSLWLRLIAALAAVMLALAAIGGGESAFTLMRFAVVGGLAFELVMCAVFAVGALGVARAAPAGGSRGPFLVGGFAGLWCAGIAAIKTCEAYRAVYGHGGMSSMGDNLLALAVAEPVVAVIGVAAVLLGLRRIAALSSLADAAGARMTSYALLMCTSVAIQSWGLPHAQTESGALLMLVLATVFSLVAIGLAAGILSRAAQTIEMQRPNVPPAKVV